MFKTCKQCQKGKNITKGLICSACKMKKKRERDKVVTGSHNKVVTVNVKADVKASGINWHPDDYQPCTDEEELLRRIELADREHRLLLKEKR